MDKFDEKKLMNMIRKAEWLYLKYEKAEEGFAIAKIQEKELTDQEDEILEYVNKFINIWSKLRSLFTDSKSKYIILL